MTEADRLDSVLREFQKLHQLMIRTPLRKDDGWKRDLIGLRRQLQMLFTQLAEVSNQIALTVPDSPVSLEYRERLSQVRHKVALHQADWPVVQIDVEDPKHRASVEGIRTACQNFIAAAEQAVIALRSSGTSPNPGS